MSRDLKITEFWNSGRTMAQIARRYGISRERVRQIINKPTQTGAVVLTGTEWRHQKQGKRKAALERSVISRQWEIPEYTAYRSYLVRERVRRLGYLVKCECCGWDKYTGALHIHHLDRNRKNNDLENIAVLCPNCHWLTHHLDGDMRNGAGPNRNANLYKKEHSHKSTEGG